MKYWALTPRQSIEAECARRGTASVVDDCVELLSGGDTTYGFISALAGPATDNLIDREPDDPNRYWLRVWGARGLLWAWDDSAIPAIHAALTDPHWRVREMAAKVIARHGLGELLEAVAELRTDGTSRVREAAERAVIQLTAHLE